MARPIVYKKKSKALAFIVFLCCFLSVLPVVSFAFDLEEARRAVRLRDFDQAFSIYSNLAISGNLEAQYQLAGFYRSGWSVKKSDKMAVEWLLKASEQGHVQAQYSLGTMYENGWGIPVNREQAMHWYQSAAFHDHEMALTKLTQLQALIEQQAKDPALKRRRDLFSAIQRGDHSAVSGLLESGVDINSRNSSGWTPLMMAVESGDARMVAILLKGGANTEATTPKGQTALLQATSQGDPVIVGELVRGGSKVNHQDGEGNTALMVATAQQHQLVVKTLLRLGASVGLQNNKGHTAARLAKGQTNSRIYQMLQMAEQIDQARQLARDRSYSKAFEILNRLAVSGDMEAQYQLAGFYQSGWSVEKSDRTAAKWLRMSADQGHVNAQYNLGTMYENGWGVPENQEEAMHWYRLAASESNDLAIAKLAQLQDLIEQQAKDPIFNQQRELFIAINQGDHSEVSRLVREGANINTRNQAGQTPLLLAVGLGDAKTVAILLKGGADPEATNPDGTHALLLRVRRKIL